MKLRSKLLLAALVLLLMPVATVKFLKSLDSWLVERESIHLGDRAQNLAAGISPFMKNWTSAATTADTFPVLPKILTSLPVLDGFETEWGINQGNWISIKNTPMKIVMGRTENYQLLFIKVANLKTDQHPLFKLHYQSVPVFDEKNQFTAEAEHNEFYISPEAPGKIIAKNSNSGIQSRIHGYWQSGSSSSSLELRVPKDLTFPQLKIQIKVDNKNYKSAWLQILQTDTAQQSLLDTVKLSAAERLWLLGPDGEVIGVKGNLEDDSVAFNTNAFLAWLIGTIPETVDDPWSGVSQIPLSWLKEARENGLDSRIEPGVSLNQKRIVSVARIGNENNLQGYVLFDKLTGTSLLLSQPQVGTLINITLGLMMLTIIILLTFGGRLSWRIRSLQKQLSNSMDEQGRVSEIGLASDSSDEIGQLSRAMNQILYRQKGYQDYQQKMASRLSHELRTPLAVVRGALDNLRPDILDGGSIELVDRATTGVDRMASLVTRMREASRLEQVINVSKMEKLDINNLLKNITSGLSAAWPEAQICYKSELQLELDLAPELIAQALEKLIANAVDFALENSEINISVVIKNSRKAKEVYILVENQGEALPQGKESQLTGNMVSVRKHTTGDSAHLGLGLYMVELIARFHGGEAVIYNRDDGLGVVAGFSIKSEKI